MHPLRALISAALLLAACIGLATSDELDIRDQINLGGFLTVRCQGSAGGPVQMLLEPSGSTTITMPNHYPSGQQPRNCQGLYMMPDVFYTFNAYVYHRDHPRCQQHCGLEAREDGWYGRNSSTGWELITPYFIHPRYMLDPPPTPLAASGRKRLN